MPLFRVFVFSWLNNFVSSCLRGPSFITLALLTICCVSDRSESTSKPSEAPLATAASDEWFVDRAAASGLDFVHVNGASGSFYYPEILPPGVGLLDYDNDGDLDVYLVQGRALGSSD